MEWIKLEDSYPEHGKSIFIYSESGGVAEGHYDSSKKEFIQYRWSCKPSDVTHWCPKLKPPTK